MGLRVELLRSCRNFFMAIYGLCAVGAIFTVDRVWVVVYRGFFKGRRMWGLRCLGEFG